MEKIYCGYDESNNSKIPEFHVLCYSRNVGYVKQEERKLKKGKELDEKIEDVLQNDFNFYFIVYFEEFDRDLNKFISENNLSNKKPISKKLIILYSFLDRLQKENNYNLNIDLFFDGTLGKNEDRNFINKILNNFNLVKNSIKYFIGGDEKYKIINFCDRIAYLFLFEFNQLGNMMFKDDINSLPNRFWENRVYINFNDKLKNMILEFLK